MAKIDKEFALRVEAKIKNNLLEMARKREEKKQQRLKDKDVDKS